MSDGKLNLMTDSEFKQCKECLEILPATEEYFYKQLVRTKRKGNFYKLTTICKKCQIIKSAKRQKNDPNMKEYKHNYYINNMEKVKEWTKTWGEENKDYKFKVIKQWQKDNPDKIKSYNLKHSNKEHIISVKEWVACKEYFNNSCAYCGLHVNDHFRMWNGKLKKIDLHREHVDPFGSPYLDNCVPSCGQCNSMKRDYKLEDWYNETNPKFTQDRLDRILKWVTEDYKIYFEGYREKQKKKQ